jgi:hypothetical protein
LKSIDNEWNKEGKFLRVSGILLPLYIAAEDDVKTDLEANPAILHSHATFDKHCMHSPYLVAENRVSSHEEPNRSYCLNDSDRQMIKHRRYRKFQMNAGGTLNGSNCLNDSAFGSLSTFYIR